MNCKRRREDRRPNRREPPKPLSKPPRRSPRPRCSRGSPALGYVARGVIYAMIGVLAIRLADGVAAPRPNQQGAMHQIVQQRFGHALLADHRHRSRRIRAVAARAGARRAHARIRRAQRARSHRRRRERGRLRRVLPARDQRASRHRQQLVRPDQEDDGRRSRMARRARARRSGRPAVHRHRHLPGVPRAEQEVPRVLEDRPDVPLRAAGVHDDRRGRARGARRRVRADRIFVLKAAIDYSPKDAVGIDGALAKLAQHAYGTTALSSSRPA